MMAMGKNFKKTENEGWKTWRILTKVLLFLSCICFIISTASLVFGNSVSGFGVDPNVVSLVFALLGLNVAVTFFIPMLITKHQVADTVRDIVDKSVEQKFFKEKIEQYATQENIADLVRKVSTLLFWQKRYIWSLSCALNALNEYMEIAQDKPTESIRSLWISIEEMINIISSKNNASLLKKEFPMSKKEMKLMKKRGQPKEKIRSKKERLFNDKKDMLTRLYIELFELVYQKEDLIHIIGYEFEKRVNHCLDTPVRSIIDMTAEECSIKYEEIELGIRENAEPFGCSETRRTAEEVLRSLIKIENNKSV
jgi:hypothetical protein